MQFKIIRHRDKEGGYREGHRVQCLRRVREVTPDFPEGKNVQRVVAMLSRSVTLQPGDLIFTGTPVGVGSLQPGDVVTGGVGNIGQFSMTVAARTA